MELPAGADAKLGEHLAEVVLNGAGADEQAGTSLRVRQTLSGQPRDLVRAAATSANGMPGCMSTAGCAPKPAAVASRPAGSCWTRSNRKLGGIRLAGRDAVKLAA